MQRRDLLKCFAYTAAGPTILKSGTLHGMTAPSNKLNLALVGAWGRGTAHYRSLRNENVVALCDVNDLRRKAVLRLFPGAKTYYDWRQCLKQKDIEAMVICTADHHHAFIGNWALDRDMHVSCEKPLGISVEEVRAVGANCRKFIGAFGSQSCSVWAVAKYVKSLQGAEEVLCALRRAEVPNPSASVVEGGLTGWRLCRQGPRLLPWGVRSLLLRPRIGCRP